MRGLAKEVLLEMEQLDLCDSVTYNTYLKAFCQNLEDAFSCLEELRVWHYCSIVRTNNTVTSCQRTVPAVVLLASSSFLHQMVSNHTKRGQFILLINQKYTHSKAKRLFTPDRVSYNSILNLAVTIGDTRQAWKIVDEGILIPPWHARTSSCFMFHSQCNTCLNVIAE